MGPAVLSPTTTAATAATAESLLVTVALESPRLQFHGDESQSLGAILSGKIVFALDPEECPLMIQSIEVKLVRHTIYCAPFIFNDLKIAKCSKCSRKSVAVFAFTEFDKCLKRPSSDMLFSRLIPGNTVATTVIGTALATKVEYSLEVNVLAAGASEPDSVSVPVIISRVIESDSVLNNPLYFRTFHPLDINVTFSIPKVVFGKSDLPLDVVIEGLGVDSWSLDRVMWKLVEKCYVNEDPCDEHRGLIEDFKRRVKENNEEFVFHLNRESSFQLRRVKTSPQIPPETFIYGTCLISDDLVNGQMSQYHPLDHMNPMNRAQRSEHKYVPVRRFSHLEYSPNTHVFETSQTTQVITFSEHKTLAQGVIHKGWKVDRDHGSARLVTSLSLNHLRSCGLNTSYAVANSQNCGFIQRVYDDELAKVNCCCDVKSPSIVVEHELVVEITVQRNSARKVLTSEFPVVLSETGNGLVSWDVEPPPVYKPYDEPPRYDETR